MFAAPLALLDDMYASPCTPLIAVSSGVVTDDSTVSGLAPMYDAVTVTVGGAIGGNCAIGSVGIAMIPTSKMTAEQTAAKIGLRTKNSITRSRSTPWAGGEVRTIRDSTMEPR